MSYDSELIRTYTERGYVHQITSDLGLDQRATEQVIPAYIGFDCTADSLHVGSLVQIMMLRVLQAHRAQADCSYGRWYDKGRRPVRQGCGPPAFVRSGH
jgi:hypothetical protein